MCGILFSEGQLSDEMIELVSRRGSDFQKLINLNDCTLFSSVLSIRSTIEQPIIENNFILQFNGEIFNSSESDTLYIKKLISKHITLESLDNLEACFEYLSKIYDEINQYENELALCIKIGRFVCFFRDDFGKRSLGYSINPFTVSSVLYSIEIDSMMLYIYDLKDKIINIRFKTKKNLISEYLDRIPTIESFLISQKYLKEFPYLSEYSNLLHSSNQKENKQEDVKFRIEEFHKLLLKSFEKRKFDGSPVVFLSGGIDSLVVAIYVHLTIDSKKSIYLINTALPESFDREMGIKAYKDLVTIFPDRQFHFIDNDLALDCILENRKVIERLMFPKTDKMTFNISCILYFSSMIASKYSKVVYLGSGADELFGGYSKYKNKEGRNHMFFDLLTISSHNLCRDDRAVGNWNVEARFPFLDSNIVLYSLKLGDSELINDKSNKIPLREILKFHGFNRAAETPKKAMQYGTGMSLFEEYLYK